MDKELVRELFVELARLVMVRMKDERMIIARSHAVTQAIAGHWDGESLDDIAHRVVTAQGGLEYRQAVLQSWLTRVAA